MCVTWRNNFAAFLRDMGPAPVGCSLDRINNNGNYEPGNCRWATAKEQANNKNVCVYLDFDGERLTLKQIAEKTGVSYDNLHCYVRDKNRSLHDALASLSPSL